MNLAAILFAAAISLPAPLQPEDESSAHRRWRLWTIAVAAADVAERSSWPAREMGVALLTKAWFESGRFALAVHDGRLRGDSGGSVCLGQVSIGSGVVSYQEWRRLTGTDYRSTRRCLAASARALEAARWHCRAGTVFAAFSLYATGKSCRWSGAYQRVRVFERLMSEES